MDNQKHGYHIKEIKKGILGEISKIKEEMEELEDAEAQGVRLMMLIELSDMLGAIRKYLEKNNFGITIFDLMKMSEVTERAFKNGHRK